MNHRELYSTMSDAEADQAFLCELQEKLNQELMKPIEERDFEKIEKWTEAICMINGTEQQIQQRAARNIMALQNRNRKHIVHSQRKPLLRRLASVCACAAIVLVANIWSVAAFDRNIFSATVDWFKGGFTLQMSEPDEIVLPATDEDPYGIVAKCEENGFTPLTPTYLPDSFELDDIRTHTNSKSSSVVFYYKKDNFLKKDSILIFVFTHFNEEDDVSPIGIPSDGTQPEEEVINGITMVTLKEDDQFKATFQYENTIYLISGYDLDYDECYKIAASFATTKK